MRELTDVTRVDPVRPPRSGGRTGVRAIALVALPARVLSALAAPLLVALILLTCLDVLLRNSGGDPLVGVIEYTEVALVVLVYLGIAEAERNGSHVAMSLVTDRLAVPVRQVVLLIGGLLLLGFLAVLAWSTAEVAIGSVAAQEVRFGSARVPVWPARALIPLALVAMGCQTAIRMLGQARELAQWFRDRRTAVGSADGGSPRPGPISGGQVSDVS